MDCADITLKTNKVKKLKPVLAQKVEEMRKLQRESKNNKQLKRGKTKRFGKDDENVSSAIGGMVKISLPTVKVDSY